MTEMVWALGVLLALLSGLFVVLGLVGGHRLNASSASVVDRRKFNAQAGRQQLRLLDQRLAASEIDEAEYALAREQLESALLRDLEQSDQQPWGLRAWSRAQLLAIPVFMTLFTVLGFWATNGGQHFAHAEQAPEQPKLEDMVAQLAGKLQREPDNLEGWIMLARSYSLMQRYQQAADAFGEANRLTNFQEPDILVAQAESLGLAQGQSLEGEPLRLVELALALNPDHIRGLWYGLIAASAGKDSVAQARYLERLEALPDLPPQLAQILQKDFGAQVKVAESEPASSGTVLRVKVEPGQAARAAMPSAGVLYVFAKASEGPPMPLAISRQSLPDQWPVIVELNDSMAMAQGMRLSDFDAWTIVARISRDGQAKAQIGDWQGSQQVSSPVEHDIRLTIDREITHSGQQ